MRLAEQKTRWHGWTIDILGTDVSRGAVEKARKGVYSQFEVQRGLAVTQMMRWFAEQDGQTWQLADEIRRMVRFEIRSLLDLAPPPPASFDIILCRNVLLYFCAERRRTVFARLAGAAAPDSVLMLGAGETVIGQTDAFVTDPDCRGLYLRAPEPHRLAAAS
jgi:chemotaxis protein methyltransferase CheR